MTTIAVVGSWHNAFVTAACLAEMGHEVTLVNEEAEPWTEWPALPIDEPSLPDLVASMRQAGRLSWSNLDFVAMETVDPDSIVWMAMDTPLGERHLPDVAPVLKALRKAKARYPRATLLVVSSQVPIGTCQRIESELGMPVAYVPENMRIGHAVEGFRNPDRLVIGASNKNAHDRVCALIGHRREKAIFLCSLETAEMIKHATNAFLAMSISFANEIASLGEPHGVDSRVVEQALKHDSRIGPRAYLRAGLGFANGTLERDLRVLTNLVMDAPYPWLLHAVLAVNEKMPKPEPTPHERHLKGSR